MKTTQMRFHPQGGWTPCPDGANGQKATLALVFWSDTDEGLVFAAVQALQAGFPGLAIIGCSTGGIIQDRTVLENVITATLISFDDTRLTTAEAHLSDHPDVRALSRHLASSLSQPELAHVFVLSDGLAINGCALAAGLAEFLPPGVAVTGGLAGDGERFQHTAVLHGNKIFSGGVVCLGLCGRSLQVGQGTRGGWIPFGPERQITASHDNVLLELDGESALELYERYLGNHAQNLPASGHLFPLHLREADSSVWVVRTILGLDRKRKALFFGGDMPLGGVVRLMRGNIDNLLDGAEEAGQLAHLDGPDALAILVSCVGRKMLLKQFVEEEIEAVAQALGPQAHLTGFYSYGEIACGAEGETCCLHNQTMTITVLQERQ
jgi:hypothetical protein